MENVTGMDQMGVREQILADSALHGEYSVLAQVVDAADFGVPQTRKRLLFIGVRQGTGMSPPVLAGSAATHSVAITRFTGVRPPRYQVTISAYLSLRLGEALQDPESRTVVLQPRRYLTSLRYLLAIGATKCGGRSFLAHRALTSVSCASVPAISLRTCRYRGSIRTLRLRLKGIPQGGNHRDLQERLLERFLTGQRWGQDNGTGRLSQSTSTLIGGSIL